MEWFRYEGAWHAIAEGKKAHCGLELLGEVVTVTAPDDELAPEPCRSCVFNMFRDEVVEEPLEDAKARGYLPA